MQKKVEISQNTSVKLSKNEYALVEILIKICRGLGCTFAKMMEILLEKIK